MELGKQIKRYRTERAWSQDALSEKVYVSRQTISNWENDKSYPDVKSLILLSEVFGVTLDQLIKGDIETMKQQIDQSDKDRFERLSWLLTVLFVLDILTPIPLAHFLSRIGIGIWLVLYGVSMYVAILVEREKKRWNIQTYKEIVAFTEGKTPDEIEKAREEGKRPYQRALLVFVSAAVALAVTVGLACLLGMLGH